MTASVALVLTYAVMVAASIAFLGWACYCLVQHQRKRSSRKPARLVLGPECDPAVVALYCQHLLAPRIARDEAQQALALTGKPELTTQDEDFLVTLGRIQSRLPASSRHP